MPYGLHSRPAGHDVSLALVVVSPAVQACVAGFVASGLGMNTPAGWMDAYRLAYEQARAALEPSRFQVMLQPCWN
jgi:hypothetical protein